MLELTGDGMKHTRLRQRSIDLSHRLTPALECSPRLAVSAGPHQTRDQASVHLLVIRIDAQQAGEQAERLRTAALAKLARSATATNAFSSATLGSRIVR